VHASAGAGKGDGEGVSMKAHKQQLALAHGKDMRARSAKRAGLSVEIPEVAMEAHMDTKACKVRRLPSRHAQLRPRIRSCLRLRRTFAAARRSGASTPTCGTWRWKTSRRSPPSCPWRGR